LTDRINVGLVGYGSQGRRIRDAILCQDDMKVIGLVLNKPDISAYIALSQKIPLYYNEKDNLKYFHEAGISLYGSIYNLLKRVDIVVDCTPAGVGKQNKHKYYLKQKVKVIFQAGESSDIADMPAYFSNIPFKMIKSINYIRIASPHAIAIGRVLTPIIRNIGIKNVFCSIIKAGSEILKGHTGPTDGYIPIQRSKLEDLKKEIENILKLDSIYIESIKVPSILLDIQILFLKLNRNPTKNEIRQILEDIPRIILIKNIDGLHSTNLIYEYIGRLRQETNNIYEVCIWMDRLEINNRWVKIVSVIDPHSVHIPEEIDAIRVLARNEIDILHTQKITNKCLKILEPGLYPK